jgi:hypothetical protein
MARHMRYEWMMGSRRAGWALRTEQVCRRKSDASIARRKKPARRRGYVSERSTGQGGNIRSRAQLPSCLTAIMLAG